MHVSVSNEKKFFFLLFVVAAAFLFISFFSFFFRVVTHVQRSVSGSLKVSGLRDARHKKSTTKYDAGVFFLIAKRSASLFENAA